jgi:hypothetical protein
MNKILVTVLLMLATVNLHAEPYWLNGKVIATGSSPSSTDGVRLPAVSVQVLDPENSNPSKGPYMGHSSIPSGFRQTRQNRPTHWCHFQSVPSIRNG